MKNLEQLGLVTLAERRVCLVRSFAIATFRSHAHRWWYVPHPPLPLNTRTIPPRFFVPQMTNVDKRPSVAYSIVLNDLSGDKWLTLKLLPPNSCVPKPNLQITDITRDPRFVPSKLVQYLLPWLGMSGCVYCG